MQFLNKILGLGKKHGDAEKPIKFSRTCANNGDDTDGDQCMLCKENEGKNLVVATLESRFSDDMVDYALDMAKRMDYGIIAVNAANLTHDVTSFFSTTQEELYADFKETAAKNVSAFEAKATGLGLKFAHTTSQSDVDHAIADITRECGHIEFIISENKRPAEIRDAAVNQDRIAQRLCVYSVN
ncbi:MAG: universal stress protein [Desulfobacterales bacterium]|nr:universal stress protein [Desulfobacterales bacterium]